MARLSHLCLAPLLLLSMVEAGALAAVPGKRASVLDQEGLEPSDALATGYEGAELRQARAIELKALKEAKGRSHSGKPPASLPAMAAKYDIPIQYNERVSMYLSILRGPGRSYFATWLARSHRFVPFFQEILASYEVPKDLVYLAMIESGFSMRAVSPAKAAGPWQFMEATAERFDLRINFWVDERLDPLKATHAAARYLKYLYGIWGDWYLAWAEYNAGPARVRGGIERYKTRVFWELANTDAFLEETQNYVPKLIAAALIAKHPDLFGFEGIRGQSRFMFDSMEIEEQQDLKALASCLRVDLQQLRDLNPELLHRVTPPMVRGTYRLRIPKGTLPQSASCEPPRFSFRGYRVAPGDTLRKIAEAMQSDPVSIIEINDLEQRPMRVGQNLVIPVPRERDPALAESP